MQKDVASCSPSSQPDVLAGIRSGEGGKGGGGGGERERERGVEPERRGRACSQAN